jgi:integrase
MHTETTTRHPGIVKRGDRYQVRYRDRRGKSHRRNAPTLAAALDLQAKLRTGTTPTATAPTFTVYADEWCRSYRGMTGKARAQTLAGYRRTVNAELVPWFGRMRLDRIERADVREWVQALAARGSSRGTCRLYLTTLRLVFAVAVADGILARNPAEGVRAAYEAPDAAETTAARVLTDDERDRLLAALPARLHLLARLLDGAGLRVGEALGLEWSDVDLGARVIYIRRRYYRGHIGLPKTKAGVRTIPITTELARHLFLARSAARSTLVVPSTRGTHLTYSSLLVTWSAAAKRIGLDGVTPHDLRHTYGSRLYAAGLDILTLSRLLGHGDVTVTMRVYVHALPGAELPDMDALVEGHTRDTTSPDTTGRVAGVVDGNPAMGLVAG